MTQYIFFSIAEWIEVYDPSEILGHRSSYRKVMCIVQ